MFSIWQLLRLPYAYHKYIWVEVLLIKETPRAILIEFDDQKAWLPKAWIIKIGKYRHCEPRGGEAISIKISLYNWTKKFS